MLDVGNLCKDALNFILAQHFGQALVLFGTGDTAIVLPFAAFHLLVIELDSIDAVDLAVKLQEFTEKKISPENFKQIRTIGDVVSAIEELL